MRLKHVMLLLAAVTACDREAPPDAYGNFEATEIVVSAQTGGQIQKFVPADGMRMSRGAVAAVIDTMTLVLERQQVLAQRAATASRGSEVAAQIRVLETQRSVALRAYERTRRLHAQQAATTQQLDQAERDYRTLVAQIAAVRAQRQSVGSDVASTEARVEQVNDRIARSTVANPVDGTVLATYAAAGEVIQPGQPLYKIADLDSLVFRAYVTGAQLSGLRLRQQVVVKVDDADGALRSIRGVVVWISSTAEFTPTPIQTRDDRGDLVYAVKINVANADGTLKLGMPGDVTLGVPASVADRR